MFIIDCVGSLDLIMIGAHNTLNKTPGKTHASNTMVTGPLTDPLGSSSQKVLGCNPVGQFISIIICLIKSQIKAFCNVFRNSQKSFHTAPRTPDPNNKGYRSFFHHNNDICIYRKAKAFFIYIPMLNSKND